MCRDQVTTTYQRRPHGWRQKPHAPAAIDRMVTVYPSRHQETPLGAASFPPRSGRGGQRYSPPPAPPEERLSGRRVHNTTDPSR